MRFGRGDGAVATGQNLGLARQLDALLTFGTAGELTDGQLLERFASLKGDAAEQAFTTLVQRHGPMVLRVCRGVLADAMETEDAFQATFLVLVKKARKLWVDDSLGPWLHQVALRTASCARADAARRQKHERAAALPALKSYTEPDRESGQLLHEEIDRLPERFRVPVVLCDLEGRTHEQAARHLGWPVGTVKSRLTRARERLRDRLTRRGMAPGAGVITTLLRPGLGELLPDALVSTTTSAAVRFAATRTILGGSAASLAQGVLTAMSMTRWWKAASVLLVAATTVSGAGLLAGRGSMAVAARPQEAGKTGGDMPVAEATSARFRVTVQRGTLETSKRADVLSQIERPVTIVSILPEGTKVKKGDLVAELDSAALRDQLTNQRITTQSAQANYQNARLNREVAEIAVKEYEEGIYLADRATIQGEIKLAESASQKAKARLERTRRSRQKLNEILSRREGAVTSGDIVAELDVDDRLDASEQAVLSEQFALEKVQSKLALLQHYTKAKMIKELRTEVEKALSAELSKHAIWQLEKDKEAKLERQIAACRILAPIEGMVQYANDPTRLDRPTIRQGATVRPRQVLVRFFDLGAPLQVDAKLPEARISRMTPGQRARVQVDAFPNESFTGVVTEVSPLPDPMRMGDAEKVYAAKIRLDSSPVKLLPGMTASVQAAVGEHETVVIVPTLSVINHQVAVKKPDGGFEWREVVLGDQDPPASSSGVVEVLKGLKPGEQVAQRPEVLIREGLNRGKPK
jgi:RNA polymerase sigma factor (sigma-70 family)